MLRVFRMYKTVAQVKQSNTKYFSTSIRLLSAYQRQIISGEEVEYFKKNGFVVLKDLLTPQEKINIVDYCKEIAEWPDVPGKYFKYSEIINGEKTLSRVENFVNYHQDIKALVDGKLTQAAADCMSESVCLFKDKINFKRPGGIGYAAHQDEVAWLMFGQDIHISALISVNLMTRDNGCLSMMPGSWDKIYKYNEHGDIDPSVMTSWKESDWHHVISEAGTVVMFTSFTPHRSEVNKTSDERNALYITWNPISKGSYHKLFYNIRRQLYPTDCERDPTKDYSLGVEFYGEQILEMSKGNMERSGSYLK